MEGQHTYEEYRPHHNEEHHPHHNEEHHPHHNEEHYPHHWSVSHSPLALISQGLERQAQAVHELQAQAIHFGLGVVAEAVGIVKHLAWQCIYPLHLGGHYPHHDYPFWKEPYHHYPFWKEPHSTTDIQLRTRLGETRIVTFLVENNRSHQSWR